MRVLAAVLYFGLVFVQAAAAAERVLSVTGEGTVTASPDMAVVRVGVERTAGTAAEALAANSAAMAAVIARLEAEGLAERDLQTSTLDLGPRYADRGDGAPQVESYIARNILTVRVRDLDRLGAILDAAASDGANAFEGLSFGMADPAPLNDEAMRLAMTDARRKAELLAREADVPLGEVIRIDAAAQPGRPYEMSAAPRMAADAIPIARGEVELSASVTVAYALGE